MKNRLVRLPNDKDGTVTLAPLYDFRSKDWWLPTIDTVIGENDEVAITSMTLTFPDDGLVHHGCLPDEN